VELVVVVAQIIVLLSLAGVAIYFMIVLTRVRSILGNIETDIKEISVRIIPVLDNLEVITSKLRSILENVDDQMAIVKNSVESIRTIADNVIEFERRIQDQIEGPVLEIAGAIGSVVRTITALINRVRGRS
jgi:uncharacterized protein YoxC